MKLTYVPVKIARSITLLVTSPVESSLRAQTAGWLLRRAQEAEAVVFVEWDGDVPRLETAGGELSVDGAMALTAWLALDNGVPMGETWDFPLALNGGALSLPCAVTPVNTCCVVTVTMPRAEVTDFSPSDGLTLPLVRYPGIAYLIAPTGAVQRTAAADLLRQWSRQLSAPAVGLLFWNEGAHSFDPLSWSKATGSAVWRRSCAGGAAAVGDWLRGKAGQSVSLNQPGGAMAVTLGEAGAVTVTAAAEVGSGRTVDLVF